MNKFKTILDKVGSDVLTEDTKTAIIDAFTEAVKEKADSRVKLEVKEALEEQNTNHAEKLEKLIKVIDEDHCKKFQKVVQKIDEDHSAKFKNVVKHYEKLLKEEAVNFKGKLVEEVSNYIELYIDKTIPAQQIQEACENSQAKRILNEMKSLLAIDEDYINENVREALSDGKSTIINLQKELNEAVKENVKLNKSVKATQAELLIEKHTHHMPKDKKNYVRRMLGDKSPEYISENFEYVVEMFERDDDDRADLIVEDAKRDAKSSNVAPPKSEVLHENINNDNNVVDGVSSYLQEMSEIDKRYR